jgi:transposase
MCHSEQIELQPAVQLQKGGFDTVAFPVRLLVARLKDFRRIATRYDRLARNFLPSIYLVVTIVWWIL